MKIVYRKADLLAATERVIIHGCNAQGVMNSGVARAIRTNYPTAYTDYVRAHQSKGLQLGEVVWSAANEPHIVGNAITQKFYGRNNIRYVSYDAVADAMTACCDLVAASLDSFKIDAIGMPFIGAGLANGSWSVISAIIEEYSQNFSPVVYYLPELLPDGLPEDLRARLLK